MKRNTSGFFTGLSLLARGKNFKIATLIDAADALLTHWKDDDGEEYVVAVKACLDAITGSGSVEAARAAFIRAAEEEGMRVISLVYSDGKEALVARSAA